MPEIGQLLASGACGVRWAPPVGDVLQQNERELFFRDTSGLGWHVALSSMPFALDPEEADALAEDLDRSARDAYALHWFATPRLAVADRPRTDDPSWSPMIESAIGSSGEQRLLRILRYLADDIIVAHAIVPVAKGVVDLRVTARGGDHPITRVRGAIEAAIARIDVTEPPPPRARETVLEEARCGFVAPPRFLLIDRPTASGQRVLHRGGLDGWKRLLDVWRVGALTQQRIDPRPAMAAHADKIVQGWSKEGCENIQTRTGPIAPFGNRPQIEQHVSYKIRGLATHTIHRWWLEPDNTIYRIGSNAPPTVPDAALRADLDAVQATWRSL